MTIKYALIILFLLFISLPTLLIGFRKEDSGNFENRSRQEFPKISLKHPLTTFNKIDAFYKDNFMFRDELSNFYFAMKQDYFGTDPLPEKVISGKNGWLFLGDSYSNVFSESIGVSPVDRKDVEKVAEDIIDMKSFCDKKGIKFYFAVAPNKESFYTQYLPIQPNNKPRKLNILKEYLQSKYGFTIIDLKEYLEPKKDSIRLFHKTDTHWNEYGSFFGTQKLIDVIRNDLPVKKLEISDYKIDTFSTDQMDLARMLKARIPEQRFRFTPLQKMNIMYDTTYVRNKSNTYLIKSDNKGAENLKSLVFRDSFFSWMLVYFSTTVKQGTYIRKKFDKKLIEKEKPDFVVVEIVERNL